MTKHYSPMPTFHLLHQSKFWLCLRGHSKVQGTFCVVNAHVNFRELGSNQRCNHVDCGTSKTAESVSIWGGEDEVIGASGFRGCEASLADFLLVLRCCQRRSLDCECASSQGRRFEPRQGQARDQAMKIRQLQTKLRKHSTSVEACSSEFRFLETDLSLIAIVLMYSNSESVLTDVPDLNIVKFNDFDNAGQCLIKTCMCCEKHSTLYFRWRCWTSLASVAWK
uniref:Uncharacterized protein n=1 Tax=Physcomitrium patens TaxID=3218 RepID=A0A2K1KVB3_PHYPA|nr:hypothetical protein PHYPA_004713 [Physcomitrium patens]